MITDTVKYNVESVATQNCVKKSIRPFETCL